MMSVVSWPYHMCDLLEALDPNGFSGKTFPAYSVQTTEEILRDSSKRFLNAGMGSPTEFLTLRFLEYPNDVEESFLSDILETGDLPQRYFLSPQACQGILHRAERRGRILPGPLKEALEIVAGESALKKPPTDT